MDCYISVFQSLSSHIDEITEERKKKKKTHRLQGEKRIHCSIILPKSTFWNNTQI